MEQAIKAVLPFSNIDEAEAAFDKEMKLPLPVNGGEGMVRRSILLQRVHMTAQFVCSALQSKADRGEVDKAGVDDHLAHLEQAILLSQKAFKANAELEAAAAQLNHKREAAMKMMMQGMKKK